MLSSLNEFKSMMDMIYEERFPGYYICQDERTLNEEQVNFNSMSMKIMLPDFI